MSNFLHNEHRKTRKDHECWGCFVKITAGTKGVYAFTCVGDETVFTGYYCPECEKFTNEKCYKCRECYDMEEAYQGYIKKCNKMQEATS